MAASFVISNPDAMAAAMERFCRRIPMANGPIFMYVIDALTPEMETIVSVMQSEVFEAFRSIDVPEDKALKAASALSKRDDDVVSVKSELLVIKWMMGFVLAFQVAIFARLFMH